MFVASEEVKLGRMASTVRSSLYLQMIRILPTMHSSVLDSIMQNLDMLPSFSVFVSRRQILAGNGIAASVPKG